MKNLVTLMTTLLTACGTHSEQGVSPASDNVTAATLEGIWQNGTCEENFALTTEYEFHGSSFKRTIRSYAKDCSKITSLHVTVGKFSIGSASTNLMELKYDGNFALKPVTVPGARELDLIEETTHITIFVENELNESPTDEECKVEEIKPGVPKDITGLCGTNNSVFTNFVINGDVLKLAHYIGNINEFDPTGSKDAQKRGNVLESKGLKRRK